MSNNNNISPRSMDELDDIELAPQSSSSSSSRRAKRCSALCKYAKPVSVAIVLSTFVVALIVIIAANTGDQPSWKKNDGASTNNSNSGEASGNYGSPVDGTFGGGGYTTTDDHNTWDNKDWYELTPAEKLAAQTLGFNEYYWDNDEKPDSCNKYWDDLTSDQKASATLLGWNRTEWDADTNDLGEDEDENNTLEEAMEEARNDNVWETYDWVDLSASQQNAAMVLGFTQVIWDLDGGVTSATELDWNDLSYDQQDAATLLGWDQESWNADEDEDEDWGDDEEDDEDEEDEEDYIPAVSAGMVAMGGDDVWTYSWSELNDTQRNAAIALGFNQILWDIGAQTTTTELDWNDMTAEQEDAATLLGWDQESWNSDEDAEDNEEDAEDDEEDEEVYIPAASAGMVAMEGDDVWDYSWSELNEEQRNAAIVLGFTQDMWDNDGQPDVADEWWDNMTTGEENAAALLGWDKESWDEDTDE